MSASDEMLLNYSFFVILLSFIFLLLFHPYLPFFQLLLLLLLYIIHYILSDSIFQHQFYTAIYCCWAFYKRKLVQKPMEFSMMFLSLTQHNAFFFFSFFHVLKINSILGRHRYFLIFQDQKGSLFSVFFFLLIFSCLC